MELDKRQGSSNTINENIDKVKEPDSVKLSTEDENDIHHEVTRQQSRVSSRSLKSFDCKRIIERRLSVSPNQSEVTSRCDDRRTIKSFATSPSASSSKSSGSPVQFFDELSMLRIVDNRQKERIHELNQECSQLTKEVDRLRKESLT